MTRDGEKSNALWDSYWAGGGCAGAALGGDSQKRTLASWWSEWFASPLKDGAHVLDIASGAYPVFLHAKERVARSRLFAMDYAASALAAGRNAAPKVTPVAGDAAAPPFLPGVFDRVCSQFGLEYAGPAAFAAAAALVAPGGRFASIAHFRGGAIDGECATNEAMLKSFARTGAVAAARYAFEVSFAAPRSHQYKDKKRERALSSALDAARKAAGIAPQSTAQMLVARYAADIERMAARRFAFAPEDAFQWLDSVERDLMLYKRRMAAMRAASLDEVAMRDVAKKLETAGLVDLTIAPLIFVAGAKPGAWSVSARRA